MDLIPWFVDVILHLDRHLSSWSLQYHDLDLRHSVLIIVCGTGLRGNALPAGRFAAVCGGALAAIDSTGTLNATSMWLLLILAASSGNEVNYPYRARDRSPGIQRKHSLAETGISGSHAGVV